MRRPAERCLLVLFALSLLAPASAARAGEALAPAVVEGRSVSAGDFFGIVGRDPWYEWDTDPARFPGAVNRDALEGMARDLAFAGAGWVRIEIRAEYEGLASAEPGTIDWRKWDWFIRECAPRHGLKVLLLLGSGLIARDIDETNFARLNDPPDRPDDTNPYIRAFTARAREVADRYGDGVAAYEILNEPNISATLYKLTGGLEAEIAPDRFGALLAEVYGALKPAHPRAELVAGGLLYGARADGRAADADYLAALYRAPRVRQYRGATGRYPFDGVASHPYFVGTPRQIVDHLGALKAVMTAAGDGSRLWLTEIGLTGTPPRVEPGFLAARPTDGEAAQAAFIRGLFPLLLGEARGLVAHAFWFKYEDYPYGGRWTEYGLVRLPITAGGAYLQPPTPRKLAFAAFQEFANPGALPTAPESSLGQPADAYYFPETRHAISGPFRQYWERNGGLRRFGYPLTRAFEVGGLRVQYFERARFEHHPEKPAPFDVELGLLTAYLTQGRSFPAATPRPGSVYFPETGHNLGGEFLRYWQARGGLASFGYPISEELREVNQADGRGYTVQYFERARFEHHPEHAGTEYVVLLGLMGREVLAEGGWYR